MRAERAVRDRTPRLHRGGRLGSPFQLLLLLASFALTGYAGVRLLADNWIAVAGWFVGAALAHDLVLLPLYTLADRALQAAVGSRHGNWGTYVRVPVFLSALLLLVWFPLVSGPAADYESVTGLSGDHFLSRWLLVSAGLLAASALLLLWRTLLRSATKQRPSRRH